MNETDTTFNTSRMDEQFNEIDRLQKQGKPFDALDLLMSSTVAINHAINREPRLLVKLKNWDKKIRTHLASLAKATGAANFSVTAGMPAGLSITVTWDV